MVPPRVLRPCCWCQMTGSISSGACVTCPQGSTTLAAGSNSSTDCLACPPGTRTVSLTEGGGCEVGYHCAGHYYCRRYPVFGQGRFECITYVTWDLRCAFFLDPQYSTWRPAKLTNQVSMAVITTDKYTPVGAFPRCLLIGSLQTNWEYDIGDKTT